MASQKPRLFLALRATHPAVLALVTRLALPVVCLTRDASALLAEAEIPHTNTLRTPAEAEITKHDVLVATLVPDRVDVLLHSLIRSCCERKAFVLVRPEDFETFSLGENAEAIKPRLIEKAFQYCGGFDLTLARKLPGTVGTASAEEELVFAANETRPWVQALQVVLSAKVSETAESRVGPTADAMAVAKRAIVDADTVDEFAEIDFIFFTDGEVILPAEDAHPSLCREFISNRGREVDSNGIRAAFSSARAAMARAVDACAFSDAPLNGFVVVRVSRRGRAVGVVESSSDLEAILKTVDDLRTLCVSCINRALGFGGVSVKISSPIRTLRKVRIAALGSTPGGTSLQPILDELASDGSQLGQLCELVMVLSDKDGAGVLRRGREFGLPQEACVLRSAKGKSRAEFDASVSDELQRRGVDLIVLVGYMRIVSDAFCATWRGRILNVHPSLLPDFAGGMDLQVHEAVLRAGRTESGCTVHLVTEVVDGGPIVLQKRCPVDPTKDTKEELKARVQKLEGPCLNESILAFATRSGYFSERLTYELAGVSTARGDELVERIKRVCKATRRKGCDVDLGGFGACFDLHSLGYEDPILVSGTDGVGTKLVLAQDLEDETTVGIDLVAMSVNDLIVQGAEPMFFLDYFACGNLSVDQGARVIAGIARGCELAGCALIGGETAEMPGMYDPGKYDLAGFALGVVERKKMLPRVVRSGDVLIGLKSSGVHSNGYSLVRKILKKAGADLNSPPPFVSTRATLKDVVMEPTMIYWKALKRPVERGLIEAMAHITGSGIPGNLPRVYDENTLYAEVNLASWDPAPIFHYLARTGPVELKEMLDTFNCGIGMILICRPEQVQQVLDLIPLDLGAFVMGEMKAKSSPTDASVVFTGKSTLDYSVQGTELLTYSQAGVDIHAGDSFVDKIKPFCKKTKRDGCSQLELGGFGALFDLKDLKHQYKEPVVVSGTDGVGTKLLLAQHFGKHDTVGIDLVAMSVNDLIVQGAEPVFFLDYLACGRLNVDKLSEVVKGIAEGCSQSECALVGGETAEMPGMYTPEEYDLAGFAVGLVEKKDILPQPSKEGFVLVGLGSSGVHSNGYSLVRKVVERAKADLNAESPFMPGQKLGDALLEPTKIYWKTLKPLLHAEGGCLIAAMSHITGSGIPGNLPRVFDEKSLYAEVNLASWRPLPVFLWLQREGNIATMEMLDTFNCGLGMILIVDPKNVDAVISALGDETVGQIGILKAKTKPEDPSVVFVNEAGFFE